MKIVLAMVASIDGKTTKWNSSDLHSWTSKEDQDYFSKLIEQNNCIIMGRKTYEAAKNMMKHSSSKLRIVLTSDPKKYEIEQIPNQLEFTSEQPHELIKRLEQNYSSTLLVGGAEINSLFLKENLVNELWLTIEPKVFGKGNSLIGEKEIDINMKLLSIEKLNGQGTLLLRYAIK
jgi:dihydrofolate reductase